MNASSRAVWLFSIGVAATVTACALALPAPSARAALPVSNGKIAFESNRPAPGLPSGFTIYTVNPDGSGVSGPLVAESADNTPAFSLDGTKLAWATSLFQQSCGGFRAIAVMNADGSSPSLVANRCLDYGSVNNTEFDSPAWSPKGSLLAFMCTNPDTSGRNVCVANAADGSGFAQLTGYANFDIVVHPNWSPDGSQIAYAVSTDGGATFQVHVVDADGSNDHAITPTPQISWASDPAWSPDGTRIAFTGKDSDGRLRVFVMNPDGTNPVQLTPSGNNLDDKQPAWSPDGKQLAFASSRATWTFNIYTMNADGSNETQVTNDANTNDEPNWGASASGDVVITDCSDPSLGQLKSVRGNLIAYDLANCAGLDLRSLTNVTGSVDISGTIDAPFNLGSSGTTTIGGSVTINVTDPVLVSIDAVAAGDLTLAANGSDSVSGETATGTTDVTLSRGTGSMHVVIPSGAFDQPVEFTITPLDDLTSEQGLGANGSPATIDPVAGDLFTFAVPTLNQDAQLTFTVDLSQLDDATKSALVNGLLAGSATIAVQGDGPNAVYQAFARCAAGQTPQSDGCVDADLLDENGQVTQDPTQAVSARFDGVAGHFSNYAVALVTPEADATPPAVTVKLTSPNSGTPDGQNGWFVTGPVQGTVTADDTQSGGSNVTSIDCGALALSTSGLGTPTAAGNFSISSDGVTHITCTATDSAGNKSSAVNQDVQLDTVKPTLSPAIAPTQVLLHGTATATPNATDGTSGIASQTCDSVDTGSAGVHRLACGATDRAGNEATASIGYVIQYQILGWFSPAPRSKWKTGQTVPIKIALGDANGNRIPDVEAQGLLAPNCRVTFSATGAQSTSACMKYDTTGHQFVYTWKLGSKPGDDTVTITVSYPGTSATSVLSESIAIST